MTDLPKRRAFKELDEVRPHLEGGSKLCAQMLEVIDRLQALEEGLRHQVGYQEHIDAPRNASTYRRAAEALLEADATLAKAAGLMSFTWRD